MKRILILMVTAFMTFSTLPTTTFAKKVEDMSYEQLLEKRMELYQRMEMVTKVPWYYLAATDSFERGLRRARRDLPKEEGAIAIYFSQQQWVGPLNPDLEDTNPLSISMFGGVGLDGNGDGEANINDDEDILFTFARHLESYGYDEENIRVGIWEFYHREKTLQLIMGHAKIYETFGTIALNKNAFPLPIHFNYSYKNTWGDARGWGGRRIHEGTDLFAGYGTPVRATTYGIIELKGWNKYGGWRVGIRDPDNIYHYFAHLSGFEKGIVEGKVVEPGTVIGYVGSSGYGKPGTSGKFPPHLHYGMYRDNGFTEWSFDPYPSLKSWEKKDRANRKKR